MTGSFVDVRTPKWAVSKLDSRSSKYIVIPSSVILDGKNCEKLVTAFSYFFVKRGLDNGVTFSVNMIARWCGKTPNRNRLTAARSSRQPLIRHQTVMSNKQQPQTIAKAGVKPDALGRFHPSSSPCRPPRRHILKERLTAN